MKTTEVCVKMVFVSRGDATTRARKLGHGLKAYLCPSCGNWHLTSQSAGVNRTRRRALKRLSRPGYGERST